jgi:hypothetical protein
LPFSLNGLKTWFCKHVLEVGNHLRVVHALFHFFCVAFSAASFFRHWVALSALPQPS